MLTKLTMPSGHSVGLDANGEVRVMLNLTPRQAGLMALRLGQSLLGSGKGSLEDHLGGFDAAKEFLDGLDEVLSEAHEMVATGVAA